MYFLAFLLGVLASCLSVASGLAEPVPSSGSVPQVQSNKPVKFRLPANKGLSSEHFLKKEYFVDRLSLDAVLRSAELITYREYMLKYGDGASVPSDVSPDRMVWALTVKFPQGLEAMNANYSQAQVFSARDAESGAYLSSVTIGDITVQKGPTLVK